MHAEEQGLPRPVEVGLALAGLAASVPVLGACAIAIAATSRGGVLFKQKRVGRGGEPFTLYKLRTMAPNNAGPGVTAGGDRRVTPVGKILRATKLDELPELWNVVKGDLSLVGPRPEVPQYVDMSDPLWREVLAERPGLTHPVTIKLRREEELLSRVNGDPSAYYVRKLLPYKLRGYAAYARDRTWRSDVSTLVETAMAVLVPSRAPPPTLEEVESA
jgi:lipopolysaccharide/colanic/teichoic acid biosynthesis glycosyltransferase